MLIWNGDIEIEANVLGVILRLNFDFEFHAFLSVLFTVITKEIKVQNIKNQVMLELLALAPRCDILPLIVISFSVSLRQFLSDAVPRLLSCP
jgi:hypothetical protein